MQPATRFRLLTVAGEGTYAHVYLDRPRGLLVADDELRRGSPDDDR